MGRRRRGRPPGSRNGGRAGALTTSSGLWASDQQPRAERSYLDVYPDLDVTRPLRIIFTLPENSGEAANVNGTTADEIPAIYRPPANVKRPVWRELDESDYSVTNANLYVDPVVRHAGYNQDQVRFEMPEGYIRTFISEGAPVLDDMNDDKTRKTTLASGVAAAENRTFGTFIHVEYDMDEQDAAFLRLINKDRRQVVSNEMFEIIMTLLEREWYKLERQMPPKKRNHLAELEHELPDADDQKCVICDDAECDNSNAIVFCDGCDIAVHQECYGVPFIPEGQWLCRLCARSRRNRFRTECIFCPNKTGAFKEALDRHGSKSSNSWAHLVCALWIPETSVGNTTYMEPICGVERVPKSRFTSLLCYICKEKKGACIQCAHKGCFQAFHATCARKARLCMEMRAGIAGAVYNAGETTAVYCHRHSPAEYAMKVDVERHLKDAQAWTVKRRRYEEDMNSNQTKRTKQQKKGKLTGQQRDIDSGRWKTNEGTPVLPQVILERVKKQLEPFGMSGLNQFMVQICRYWALKRQMKCGAALIKRYQIALEVHPKRMVSREDQERTVIACETELAQIEELRQIIEQVVEREETKLELAEIQECVVDKVYYPCMKWIRPIWHAVEQSLSRDKALLLGGDKMEKTVKNGFDNRIKEAREHVRQVAEKVSTRQVRELGEFRETVRELLLYIGETCPQSTKTIAKIEKQIYPRLDKAENLWDAVPKHNGAVDLRGFKAKGLEINEEQWIGWRLAQEEGLSECEEMAEQQPSQRGRFGTEMEGRRTRRQTKTQTPSAKVVTSEPGLLSVPSIPNGRRKSSSKESVVNPRGRAAAARQTDTPSGDTTRPARLFPDDAPAQTMGRQTRSATKLEVLPSSRRDGTNRQPGESPSKRTRARIQTHSRSIQQAEENKSKGRDVLKRKRAEQASVDVGRDAGRGGQGRRITRSDKRSKTTN